MKLLIPFFAILVGVAVAWAIATSGNNVPGIPKDGAATEQLAPEALVDSPETSGAEDAGAAEDTEQGSNTAAAAQIHNAPDASDTNASTGQASSPDQAASTGAFTGLHAVPTDTPLAPALGGHTPDNVFKLSVEFTSYGAGIRRIALTDYDQFVEPTTDGSDKLLYQLIDVDHGLDEGESPAFYPYAAQSVTINGQLVPLDTIRWSAQTAEVRDDTQRVTFTAPIANADGRVVATVTRVWSITAGSFDLQLQQSVANHTDQPIDVIFRQYGQGDVLMDLGAYLGDRRMFITGHFRPENPEKYAIYVDGSYIYRSTLLKQKKTLWPNDELKKDARLAWLASENRYFALITHAPVPQDATATAQIPELDGVFPGVSYRVYDQKTNLVHADKQRIAVELTTATRKVAAGGSTSMDLAIFAGPRQKDLLEASPYDLLHFDKLIRYELGCSWFTFQWLAKGLLGYLRMLHSATGDWGIAIIILVLTVRLILHPITKRAQTNMMKMSKQMGKLQPEMAKLKEKYKNDPSKLNTETMKLYREAGVNPANMLGCLPMLLQTPIWIALYAMLYFAIELRHEPAFYGVFQSLTGGNWHFLQDLSVSDNFLRFIPPDQPAYKLTWLPFVKPEFRSFNILPILMAFVFFYQMKLTTPPPQNDQQKQQQAIMKFMPFLFPVFLYSAPAGLTLYICCSTLAGIADSYFVRKHVREQEEAGTLFDKKPIKPGGFRDRMQKRIELASQMAAERQKESQRQKNAGGGKGFKKRK